MLSGVRELVDLFPTRCLVRKIVTAMTIDDVCRGDGTRSRRLGRGETLTLVRVTGQRLLQCRDEQGRGVYLPLNQRGMFSAVSGSGGHHTAACVYTLRSLLAEFRLPIIVRLVCGTLPTRDAGGGDLRLVGIQTDRVTFVLPLRHAWTSKSVDRCALVAVPSRHSSRLTVAAAARDFYNRWAKSDDGLELTRRCDDIVKLWKTSVHVVSSAVAAAAAAAASSAVPRGDDGDDTTWSRGPMGSSVDSGLASSTSSPCFVGNAVDDDDGVDVGHLEEEIDDIYAMIRYGGAARRGGGRARSLDERLSAGDVLSHKPTLAVYSGRRPSVDVLCVPLTPLVTAATRPKQSDVGHVAGQPSYELGVDNVQLVGVTLRLDDELDDDDDDDNILSVDRDSHEVVTNSGRFSDPNISPTYDELSTRPQRPRSTSLPAASAVLDVHGRRDAKSHRSLIGTFTRSIANVFRRIRPRKASHTFTFDTGLKTYASERYTRRPSHCNDGVDN